MRTVSVSNNREAKIAHARKTYAKCRRRFANDLKVKRIIKDTPSIANRAIPDAP